MARDVVGMAERGSMFGSPRRLTALARAREWVMVAGMMLALSIVTTWPLVRDARGALPSDLGDPLLNTFILAWDADRILHGLAGLWNAPFFFPLQNTLALSEHLLGIALFTAPLQWLTRNPVLVYNAAFLGSYVLAGTGMYFLARLLWGRRDAAAVAALAFACAPHRAMQASHLQVLMSGWMPIGSEWIRIAFDRDRDIGCLDFDMGRDHVGEYPRELVIESEAADRSRQNVFVGSVLTRLIEGIGRDGRSSRTRIELPANQSRGLWIRQIGRRTGAPWTIAELSIWQRR